MATDKKTLLETIQSPRDMDGFDEQQLNTLCSEIRERIIQTVSHTGGHLASNLGVVELTVALHKSMHCPDDQIVWDVGHQCYAHKLLTGRYERFGGLRQKGGLSGFPNPKESVYDAFVAGHSSTAVSAACGMARANTLAGNGRYTVAVLGDGALTGGMAYEGLNNAGHSNDKLIVILNDNRMSIGRNVGFVARHLSNLRSRSNYVRFKRGLTKFLMAIPLIGKPIYRLILRIKLNAKYAMYDSSTMFEDMGFYYFGPINGHDIGDLTQALATAKDIGRPVLLHVETQKGKGYAHAENDPSRYHGLGAFDIDTGEGSSSGDSFSAAFGRELTQLAAEDKRLFAITAAMRDGTGLKEFAEKYPDRFADVGIAEEHAVTFAAGLSAGGCIPVISIYSTFLQRAYDNIIHDVALQNLPVVLCVDRAGLNAADGATHHGIFDVAFLSEIPGMRIYTPVTRAGLRLSLEAALRSNAPAAIRYSNGYEDRSVKAMFYGDEDPVDIGIRNNYKDPSVLDAVIVTHGRIVKEAMKASTLLAEQGKKVGILLLEQLKPYEETAEMLLPHLPEKDCKILFLEEEIRTGGMGMLLSDALSIHPKMRNKEMILVAIDESFVVQEKNESILKTARLDADSIVEKLI